MCRPWIVFQTLVLPRRGAKCSRCLTPKPRVPLAAVAPLEKKSLLWHCWRAWGDLEFMQY